MQKKIKTGLWVTGIATVLITGIMNIVLMPQIEATTQGIRCFDMNSFGYSYETAYRFLALLSEQGRNIYLHIQLPLDFVYPILYTIFFLLLFYRLQIRPKALSALPVLLFISDYTENIFSVRMLQAAVLLKQTAAAASTVTVIKSILMYACFAVILIALVRMLINRQKQKRSA